MGQYAQFFEFPGISKIHAEAIYGHWRFQPIPGITKSRKCHICGREESRIVDFIKLTTMFVNDDIIYECQYHGGKYGKFLPDCNTGEIVCVPPEPHRIVTFLRNNYQNIALKILIAVRFVWFYSRDVFYYLITRNDAITNVYRKLIGQKPWRNVRA